MFIKNSTQEEKIPNSPQIADHVLNLLAQDIVIPMIKKGLLDEEKQRTLLLVKDVVIALSQKAHAYEKIYQSKNASHIRN